MMNLADEAEVRPVISVAIATYNGARYLREQLDSIYAPCPLSFEVVVSDDGSSDGTREIVRDYARTHGLRDVSDNQRRGFVKNFEHVLRHCRGDYIALADQDDIWLPGRLGHLRCAIEGYAAVYSLIGEVLKPDGTVGLWTAPVGMREFAERHGTGQPTARLLACNWVISHTMMIRRETVATALPIPAEQPYHDAWLAVAASALGGIRYEARNLTRYREHAASLTATAQRPSARWVAGLSFGLTRPAWLAKCHSEIARLSSFREATFLSETDRESAARLRRYYERGLSRGIDLRMGWESRRLADDLFPCVHPRLRRNFVLRGLFGAI
jgi:glycosyltransferase involved in cell wall biosynthesis